MSNNKQQDGQGKPGDESKEKTPTLGKPSTTAAAAKGDKSETPKEKKPASGAGAAEEIPEVTRRVTAEKVPGGTKKPSPSTAQAPAAKQPASFRAGLIIAGLALLLVIAAGAGLLALYTQVQGLDAEVKGRLSTLADAVDSNDQRLSAVEGLQSALDSLRSEVADAAAARSSLAAEQQAINTAMEEMTARLGRTTLAWHLAEAEYLLAIANQRLTLARDRDTALAALETADSKLRVIGDPAFVPVRQAIRDEITALKAVAMPDITGMALSLGSLADAVKNLPLIDTTPRRMTQAEQPSGERHGYRDLALKDLPAALWRDLRSLVVIRRVDQPVQPLLPPDEEWYLRQNLQLKLEQARLSLLRGETALFRHQLGEAESWLRAYFNPESAPVKAQLETLASLQQIDLRPALPTLGESLRLLREQMQRLGAEIAPAAAGGDAT